MRYFPELQYDMDTGVFPHRNSLLGESHLRDNYMEAAYSDAQLKQFWDFTQMVECLTNYKEDFVHKFKKLIFQHLFTAMD